VPPRKRKVTYPAPRSAKPVQRPGAGPDPALRPGDQMPRRPTVVEIDTNAGNGRSDLSVGDRVRITGSGLYSGETAVIERFSGGVIPAALVRTEAGRTRQVRTIDLEPVGRSE
jgi:hypothetical protein